MITDYNVVFSCISTNNLDEIVFIAGTYYELTFNVSDELDAPIDLNGATVNWVLSAYGDPANTILQKTGTITDAVNGVFKIILIHTDTDELGGKYLQQPIITDSLGKDFRPGQGIVTITKAIPYI
jgi:hypothetical protein